LIEGNTYYYKSRQSYYKLRQLCLLKIATVLLQITTAFLLQITIKFLQIARGITNYHSYYKLRQNKHEVCIGTLQMAALLMIYRQNKTFQMDSVLHDAQQTFNSGVIICRLLHIFRVLDVVSCVAALPYMPFHRRNMPVAYIFATV